MQDPNQLSPPMAAPAMINQGPGGLIRCPNCGSTQFFGRRRVTTMGWILYGAAIVNLLLSAVLMFIFLGFCTIFLTPVLAIIGFHGCRENINVCAACRKEF